ncbi:neuroguidin-like isoform X1, partial [Dinothrombium tinctorium]
MGENETDFDRDTSEAITVLNDIRENSRSTNTFVEQIVERFRGEQLRTSNGISFLDLKNATFLSYLVDLALVALKKCKGESIDGSEVIDRLVEHRTVLEKIRPINHKLKYQIDKLVNIANTGAVNANDPLSLKPKPENLMVDEDDEDEQNDEENEQFDDEEFDFDMENGEEAED